jgi:hypothetical protein
MRRVRRTVFLAGLVAAGLVIGAGGYQARAATASSPAGSWGTAINVPGTSAAVTSKSGTPGGRVTIKAGTKTVCTITLKSGKGSCTLSAKEFSAGKCHLTANYVPTWPYARSASSSWPLTVKS